MPSPDPVTDMDRACDVSGQLIHERDNFIASQRLGWMMPELLIWSVRGHRGMTRAREALVHHLRQFCPRPTWRGVRRGWERLIGDRGGQSVSAAGAAAGGDAVTMSDKVIQGWYVTAHGDEYTAPDRRAGTGGEVLVGTLPNGKRIRTAAIKAVDGRRVTTSFGSAYFLGDPSNDYAQWCRENGHHSPLTAGEPIRMGSGPEPEATK